MAKKSSKAQAGNAKVSATLGMSSAGNIITTGTGNITSAGSIQRQYLLALVRPREGAFGKQNPILLGYLQRKAYQAIPSSNKCQMTT